MTSGQFGARWRQRAVVSAVIMNMVASQAAFATQLSTGDSATISPIKHVIVIIGENRSFDHVFGTYVPKQGQTVNNILSEGIVDINGNPGPNFAKAAQFSASDTSGYQNAPSGKKAYKVLPAPGASGAPTTASDTDPPPFAHVDVAANFDDGLYPGDLKLLTTGATGLPSAHQADTRIRNVNALPNGPFDLAARGVSYHDYTGSPVHRFYQMWQQSDCSAAHATAANPTGCLNDLYPWVEVTVSAGSNGAPQPAGYNNFEGATSMGFYNIAKGDSPYFKELADTYSISDNYHQGVMGGTGANHVMIGYADAIYYSDANGNPAKPPAGQIEDPNAQKGTNNFYANDGYGSSVTKKGGTYSNCSDTTQAGVKAVTAYLASVKVPANCQANAYYLLNNYNPAYVGNGTQDKTDSGPFTIPPTTVRHIGDALSDGDGTHGPVSWKFYGEDWDLYVQDPASFLYCNICNPFNYAKDVMTGTDPASGEPLRAEHIQDISDLMNDIRNNELPAVSMTHPGGFNDGHPASSKNELFESYVKNIVTAVQASPEWASTAILITYDEGGGYWDSGYVQPVDFFGDGTRIPLIVVSPFAQGGRVVHDYYDHASIVKFIERNWNLKKLTTRSRDNLPNPVATKANPYVPTNRPAIGDLFEMFTFKTAS